LTWVVPPPLPEILDLRPGSLEAGCSDAGETRLTMPLAVAALASFDLGKFTNQVDYGNHL
jgi:hypothetical protein